MPSATLQAYSQAPVILPSERVLTDPSAADAWFHSLPAAAQDGLSARMTLIVRNAPAAVQMALQRYLARTGHANPVPSGVDGLGFYHNVSIRGQGVAGLGQWGALISGVMQVGAGLYTAHENKDLAKDLQSSALANDRAIAQATLAMQKETELAMINAQREAAQIAGGASVARAATYAPVIGSSLKWIGLAVVAVAAVGGGAWFVTRRKKK